jgi:hypothetical protein
MSINLLLKNWIPKNLTRQQRVMAEEILDKNSHDHAVTILPSNEGNELPPTSEMVPIYHAQCNSVAFYYTHRLQTGEVLTATRAKFPDGTRPDRGQPFICGSCKERIHFVGDLKMQKREGVIAV